FHRCTLERALTLLPRQYLRIVGLEFWGNTFTCWRRSLCRLSRSGKGERRYTPAQGNRENHRHRDHHGAQCASSRACHAVTLRAEMSIASSASAGATLLPIRFRAVAIASSVAIVCAGVADSAAS